MSGCAATPTSFVEYDTAYVAGTAYTAQPVTWNFNEEFGFVAQSYTYSNLPATVLTPGGEVTLVYTYSPSSIASLVTPSATFMFVSFGGNS